MAACIDRPGRLRPLRLCADHLAPCARTLAVGGLPEQCLPEQSLSDTERDGCIEAIDRDGYCVLPLRLPPAMVARATAYIDAYCADPARYGAAAKTVYSADSPVLSGNGLSETNIVEQDPIWRDFLTYKPAMQLCYDCFGPLFRLGQDKWTRKYRKGDPDAPPGSDELPQQSIGWHSDGPVGFPEFQRHVPFHTLRFGFFLSDAMHEGSGTVENMRGSHRSMTNA